MVPIFCQRERVNIRHMERELTFGGGERKLVAKLREENKKICKILEKGKVLFTLLVLLILPCSSWFQIWFAVLENSQILFHQI